MEGVVMTKNIIDFFEAKNRLRPENNNRTFLIVELPADAVNALGECDRPEWIDVLDYLLYGQSQPRR